MKDDSRDAPTPRDVVTARLAGIEDGRDVTRGYVDALPYLTPEDSVLRLRGHRNYEIYEELIRDDEVKEALQQRMLALVSRPFRVVPGGERRRDRQAADMVGEYIEHVRWDTVTEKMLYAIHYGYSVGECMWVRDGRHVAMDALRVRKRSRFVFDAEFRPKLLTTSDPEGEKLPPYKFWTLATGADNDDEPYGRGLGHQLYWPVYFRRHLVRYWLILLERFGQPTPRGKYPNQATKEEQQILLKALDAIRTDGRIAHPDTMEVDLLEATRGGTVDYAGLHDRLGKAITKVIVGQTMTSEDGSSLSQAEVHLQVRNDIVKADSLLVNDSFNRSVARWLVEWNYPGAAYPRVERELEDAPDLDARAKRDETICRFMGRRPSVEYVTETYDMELVENVPPPRPFQAPEAADFAETDPDALRAVIDAISADEWRDLAAPVVEPVLDLARRDPEGFAGALAALEPDLDTRAIEDRLARVLYVADLWGSSRRADDA